MKKYIVGLEVVNGTVTQWIAPWMGDPGRMCIEQSAKRYKSVSSATHGLAEARIYRTFADAKIIEVES